MRHRLRHRLRHGLRHGLCHALLRVGGLRVGDRRRGGRDRLAHRRCLRRCLRRRHAHWRRLASAGKLWRRLETLCGLARRCALQRELELRAHRQALNDGRHTLAVCGHLTVECDHQVTHVEVALPLRL